MQYPSSFYFNSKQPGLSHTNQPSGILDVSRLIQNKKPFKNTTLISVQKPKTLILSDWTAEYWSNEKMVKAQKILARLIDDGFPLYLWQNILEPFAFNVLKRMDDSWHDDLPDDRSQQGELYKLTKDELFSLFPLRLELLTPVPSNKIKQIAVAQCQLSPDKIFILDNYWMDVLFNDGLSSHPHQLYLSELYEQSDKLPQALNIAIHESTPPLEYIIYDEFPPDYPEPLSNLTTFLLQIKSIERYKKLTLNKELADELLSKESITANNITFNLEHLSNIQSLSIYEEIGINTLQRLLAKIHNLTVLKLILPQDLSKETILELEGIEHLFLQSGTFSMNLLAKAKHLKMLHILDSTVLPQDFKGNLNFEMLKQLHISDSAISAADLQQIISPHLIQLSLNNCRLPANALEQLNLQNLLKLELRSGGLNTISAAALENLLHKNPKLQVFWLFDSTITDNFSQNINLKHLKDLTLSGCNTSRHNIQNILSGTEKLKYLRLAHSIDLPDNFIETLHLHHLIHLDVEGCNINARQLQAWLKTAPNLKKLCIADCNETLHIDSDLKKLMQGIVLELGDIDEYDDWLTDQQQHDDSPTEQIEEHSFDACMPMDADTHYSANNELAVNRVFYPLGQQPIPEIRNYRVQAFNKVGITPSPCSLDEAFLLKNDESTLSDCPKPILVDELQELGEQRARTKTGCTYYLGKQTLRLTREWQALTSLSPQETLTHFSVDSGSENIEFSWSARDNLYYVRSTIPGLRKISFLLEVARTTRTAPLPQRIHDLIKYCSEFGSGALAINQEAATGIDYLNSLITQKKGACRHRALVFKVLMEKYYPEIPVRIITNQCHAFVEINLHHQWVAYDLGGYPVQLSVNESWTPAESIPSMPYEKQLQTWKKHAPYLETILGFCQHLTQPGEAKKRLIELTSSDEVHHAHLQLQSWCKKIARPFFYINAPDDLMCSAPFLKREGNRGILMPGPGGPLYDFLQQNKDKSNPAVLIINYDNFEADDLVRFNSLLDKERLADGVPIPPDTLIIGLINSKKPDCYQGADFYSRFNLIEQCPDGLSLSEGLAPLPLSEKTPELKTVSINLYNAPDWEERLLGRWIIQNDALYFIEGALQKAFHSAPPVEPQEMPLYTVDELQRALGWNFPLELKNAPWEDKKFVQFWQQACLLGKIEQAGRVIHLPDSLQLLHSSGYDWEQLTTQVTWQAGLTLNEPAYVLNAQCLNDYFTRYCCNNETQMLNTLEGLIQAYTQEHLQVNLTGALSDDKWALFLSACQEHAVQLTVHCAPGIPLPAVLGVDLAQAPRALSEWTGTTLAHTTILVSTDCDTTAQQLTSQDKEWQVIESSECEGDDLLIHIKAQVDALSGAMRFEQKHHALLLALEQGNKVMLKGRFSSELVDSLAPFLLARRRNQNSQGQLVLLSENDPFHYLPAQKHEVSRQEKQDCLQRHFSADEVQMLDESLINQEPLSLLHARLSYQRATQTKDAWQGLQGLSSGVVLQEFNAQNSAQIADEFEQQRLDAVNRMLTHAPYVFLTGLTAVGKSTFVEKNFNTEQDVLYIGEALLSDWAKDASSKRKILFIDEANLSEREWSEFEGLFNNPPGILIEGHYYPLTSAHKVLFAGNPVSYGDERRLAPFFSRHGNALVFESMPQEFIYERILKPIFMQSKHEAEVLNLCAPLLNIYKFLGECSTDKILISPRELQMMALLVLSYQQQHPEHEDILAAQHYAWYLASTLVPEQHREELDKQFKPKSELVRQENLVVAPQFLVTPSRQQISHHLNDVLALRQFRCTMALNEAQRYGGLGGIVLEGEPGIGKSELVLSTLIAQGYQEVHHAQNLPEKPFYRIPVSMQMEDKKNLLLKAFHQGAVVIIDEINSSPMMERLLNDLLMGKTPEGKRPERPGFLIIGTQNPVTMNGRRAPSTALARRLMTVTLPAYTRDEMETILINKGLHQEKTSLMVAAYAHNVAKAQKKNLTPQPTFRDLLQLAELEIKKEHTLTPVDEEMSEVDQGNLLKRKGFFAQPTQKKVKAERESALQNRK
ncbi:AAA family ATPase [Legionella drancourtii]|nr:AAA family ATPase [Legionella drancourtii]